MYWVKRLVTALSLQTVAAVVLAGCAAGHAPAGAGTPAKPGRSSPGRASGLLHGKYQSLAVAFPGGGRGFALISGYPGTSATVRSWVERTADGGRHWTASPPVSGKNQPGTQAGLAFMSASQGWAYLPGLFFTRDGGATWRAERTPFPLTGPVAVAGTSTWVAGYSCACSDCPAVIYTAHRVGGPLRRLAHQPLAAGTVVAMARPSRPVAWLLFESPHGRFRLMTTSDTGHSWTARPLPCPATQRSGEQLSAAGSRSLWLVCEGTPGAGSLPGTLYRSADGGRRWNRIAVENALQVHAVSDRVAWAIQGSGSGAAVVRTTDGGRTWRTVLSRTDANIEAFAARGPDSTHAVAEVLTSAGIRFVAYQTLDAGQTWQRARLPA
jgi:photosystem II stability/assembly factor-like uncharacterized protein